MPTQGGKWEREDTELGHRKLSYPQIIPEARQGPDEEFGFASYIASQSHRLVELVLWALIWFHIQAKFQTRSTGNQEEGSVRRELYRTSWASYIRGQGWEPVPEYFSINLTSFHWVPDRMLSEQRWRRPGEPVTPQSKY